MAGLEGIINLDKPTGLTSAKALYRVRKLTGQRKSGHAGTLDPGASGVLLLCLGRGTKLVERLMDHPKVYRTTARLDVTSESLDADSPLQPVPCDRVPALEQVQVALAGLTGAIEQVPPTISALKVGGRAAYKLARAGQAPALAARTVQVYWIELHRYEWPEVELTVACGRGTYVRALARDLGAQLGLGGCVMDLRRLAVGPFRAEEAWTLERLDNSAPEEYLISLESGARLATTMPTTPVRPPGSVDFAGE